jgi:thioredoxin 1
MKIVELTDANAQEVLANNNVIVDFWADWCGPCKQLSKNIEEAAKQIDDNVIVAKCNVEDNIDLTELYRIQNLPTLLHFKNGELIERSSGLMTVAQLVAFATN